MAQKVISINLLVNDTESSGFREHEFPEVKKALDEGYEVTQVVPSILGGLYVVNLTFVLTKSGPPSKGGMTRVN